MWVDHPDFLNVVVASGSLPVYGSLGIVFSKKIARLRKILKDWNWSAFGNIFTQKKNLQNFIQTREIQLQDDLIHTTLENKKK